MRLNSKLTWGLAWAGLALVIAVPSLDAFSGNSAAPALITSDSDQVKVATASPHATTTPTPTATPTVPKPGSVTINPDGTVVRSASQSTTPSGTTTPAATTSAAAPAETKTASVEQATRPPLVAPIPAPASARPKSQPSATATPAPAVASVAPPQSSQPLIIDEPTQVPVDDPSDLIPPEDIPEDDPAALRAYLESRGLLEPYDGRSSASVQRVAPPADIASDEYDPDGFYLSDGPNSERRTTRRSARSAWFYDEYGNLIFY